jgi:hypothetical protein
MRSSSIKTIFLTSVIFALLSCSKKDSTSAESPLPLSNSASVTIVVDSTSYTSYPAVWFSSIDGSVKGVISGDTPPESKYDVWIEPRDPEIAVYLANSADAGAYGIQIIGDGQTLFANTTSIPASGYLESLPKNNLVGSVCALHTKNGNGLIHILELNSSSNRIKFEWKK